MSTVIVVGLGYVGLPLAIRAADVGHDVTGVDLDARKIESLRSLVSYIEDVSDERLQVATESGRFHAEVHLPLDPPRAFDVAIIAVPTPLRGTEPDLSYVAAAGRMVGHVLRPGATVVLESTTYPGTTEGLLSDVLEAASGLIAGVDFHLGFSPERIDPGSKKYTLQNTPKLVSGTTEAGLQAVKAFYDTVVDQTVSVSGPKVAELTKLFENIQANVLIALINEVSEICHDLEIDVWEMIDASMTKGHSMSRWTPGPGVGGHCLPIDPLYLAWLSRKELGRPFRFAELADEINHGRPQYVADRAVSLLEDQDLPVHGTEVLVLGVAYKPDVGDVRESPAVEVVDALVARGMVVTVADPHVPDWQRTAVLPLEDMGGALARFPLVIIVTDHADFDFDKIGARARMILDCRNAMRPAENVIAL